MNKLITENWWDEFFTEFRPFFAKISPQVTNAEVKFYIEKMNLKKGSSFLDCPIGIGRIAIPLAKKGIKITGVDIMPSYLAELSEKASKAKLPIKLFHLDMRKINFENQFDAVGNLWTSFGYFKKESDNMLVLKKLYKALKPGGKFVIQVINRDWIMKNFASNGWSEIAGAKVLEKRNFDFEKSISTSEWIFIKDGQEKSIETYIRMYSFHEFKQMLEKVGFTNIVGYGSLKSEPINFDSREMFIFADK